MNINSNDEVVRFINEEKESLRAEFRTKRKKIEELNEQIASVEMELNRIKDRLKFTDSIIERRLGKPSLGPSLAGLGSYAGKGMKESIEDFFKRNPASISVPELAERLLEEGLTTSAANLQASVFTTCKRLEDLTFLTSSIEGRIRLFRLRKKEG